MGRIIYLASYPKSGNTWMRIFISNLLRDKAMPAAINALDAGNIASSRDLLDDAFGVESGLLRAEEIARFRGSAVQVLAPEQPDPWLIKIHDAFHSGLLPADSTQCILYIVRDPRDVAVSQACAIGLPLPQVVDFMRRNDAMIRPEIGTDFQVQQRLLSWSGHVSSWLDQQEAPVYLVRYEDMLHAPQETFTAAMAAVGLPCDAERIARAVRHSHFAELQRQERDGGFNERLGAGELFFREGRSGGWRDHMDAGLAGGDRPRP